MKKFDYYCRHLEVLKRAEQEDLYNEFIVSGIIDKFFLQFEQLRAAIEKRYGNALNDIL